MSVKKYMSGVHSSVGAIENRATKPNTALMRTPSKVEQYAAEFRRRLESKERTGTAGDYLAAPLLDCDLGHIPSVPLISWIFFNQFRPMMEALYFTQIRGTAEGFLFFQRRHSDGRCQYAVYGLIPFDDEIEQIKHAVVAMFKANGHSSLPLFQSLPTSIFHFDNWQSTDAPPVLRSEFSRTLLKCAAASLWPVSMASVCDHLRRYPDPWQRILTENANRKSGEDNLNQSIDTFNEVQYNEWFGLVTDPTHIEEERTIFRTDWQEAQMRIQEEQRVIVH